jgi:membrane fusion protein (multidrug efflux system)
MNPAKEKVLLAAALSFGLGLGCERPGSQAEPPIAPPPPAIHVESQVVQAKPMPHDLPLTGSLVSNQQSEVAANASGRVVKTFVERGSVVKLGDPLVQLDVKTAQLSEAEAKANLESAQVQEDLAKSQCARSQGLFDKGAITREEYDRTQSQCRSSVSSAEAAKARAELAAKTLTDSTVRAPFAGMISERYVSLGEYVQPPTRVASMVELDPLRLQLTVAESDIGQIHEGLEVRFEVAAFPGKEFSGLVKYIDPAVRANTRDLLVEALVDNKDKDHLLRAGMFATAHLQLPDQPLPVVPLNAVRGESNNTHVFVVNNGTIEERIIQTGPTRDGVVAILDGLKTGDRVVLQPNDQVRDGIPVN